MTSSSRGGAFHVDFFSRLCGVCGKEIYFTPLRQYKDYAYKMEMVETGEKHKGVYCSWSCYVKAKRAWCEKRLASLKTPKENHPCQGWLDSFKGNPSNEYVLEHRPAKKGYSRKSKKEIIEKHFDKITERREQGYSWKEIAAMLDDMATADCIRRNYDIIKGERDAKAR